MKYKVITIIKDSDHEAVGYLEDEYLMIVQSEKGDWCKADEFFHMYNVKEFEVTSGEE